jgi:hypothetical protein
MTEEEIKALQERDRMEKYHMLKGLHESYLSILANPKPRLTTKFLIASIVCFLLTLATLEIYDVQKIINKQCANEVSK